MNSTPIDPTHYSQKCIAHLIQYIFFNWCKILHACWTELGELEGGVVPTLIQLHRSLMSGETADDIDLSECKAEGRGASENASCSFTYYAYYNIASNISLHFTKAQALPGGMKWMLGNESDSEAEALMEIKGTHLSSTGLHWSLMFHIRQHMRGVWDLKLFDKDKPLC